MRSAPTRHPLVVLVSAFATFLAGPALGVAVAGAVAPGSELGQIVSPLAFALIFAVGLVLWLGVGLAALAGGTLTARLRGRTPRRPPPDAEWVPPGHGAFGILGLALGLVAGAVVGLSPRSPSLLVSCAAHLAAGWAYGGLLAALARSGYLPFRDPS